MANGVEDGLLDDAHDRPGFVWFKQWPIRIRRRERELWLTFMRLASQNLACSGQHATTSTVSLSSKPSRANQFVDIFGSLIE